MVKDQIAVSTLDCGHMLGLQGNTYVLVLVVNVQRFDGAHVGLRGASSLCNHLLPIKLLAVCSRQKEHGGRLGSVLWKHLNSVGDVDPESEPSCLLPFRACCD